MQPSEQQAILAIALAAAVADGSQDDREREQLRQIVQALQPGPEFNMAAVLQDALLGRVDLAAQAARLGSHELKQLTFEFAVGVCDADGLRNAAETRFLADLGGALGLTQPQMVEPAARTDAIVTAPLDSGATKSGGKSDAALDKMILDASITNGALELLPQTLASIAIIALQMRLVYRIGAAYGEELDRSHVKDFLAAAGVGLTGQYLERIGRGIVGGLFGAVAGNLVGALARGATGAAFSFATTYALGELARRYYASGRQMNAALLKETYAALLDQAKGLQGRYRPQVEQRAAGIDAETLAKLAREG